MSATMTPLLQQLADSLERTAFDDCRLFDPQLPSMLREHADQPTPHDATADRLVRLAAAGLARIGVRSMLGLRGYRRVEVAALAISELSTSMYERSRTPATIDEHDPDDQRELRRTMRAVAAGYTWSQLMADAPTSLARPLARSLARQLAASDGSWPSTRALLQLHQLWLATLDPVLRAEYEHARSAFDDTVSFDVGVACSIARRLVVHAAARSGKRVTDSSDARLWLRLLGPA